ncbi:unnamed protein product [Adineta ricciae]|uniref:Uncharacterized protein n=1 Tax=Adineta ricciae TaxID=249248 RepID=A0A815EPD5_ADIRI|nr:unnamed protein product [Adineta ricciae]
MINRKIRRSEEELPFPRPQYTSLAAATSLNVTPSHLSTSSRTENEFNEIVLPYPLRLEKDYLYEIGLNPDEFIDYCRSQQMKFMFDSPMDIMNHFIQHRLKQGLDIGLNDECLNHLNNVQVNKSDAGSDRILPDPTI